jgi:hypothetical protein
VITFTSELHDDYRFAKINGHLVTVRHLHETSASGGGESGQTRKLATLVFSGS